MGTRMCVRIGNGCDKISMAGKIFFRCVRTVVGIGSTSYVDEGVVEILIDQTVLEFLYEIQHAAVKILRGPGVILELLLRLDVTVDDKKV